MNPKSTQDVVDRFNRAFAEHDPSLLDGIVAADCVMETIQPAPNGERMEGGEVNLKFWRQLAADRSVSFDIEETIVMGDRVNIRWRFNFGDGQSVRGVNLVRVRDGQIVEALAYAKAPAVAPLPD
jgi:ketosteroid isomerase-like protein